MSIQPIEPDDVESFTLRVNPARTFISSAQDGITGTIMLFARSSPIEKEASPLSPFMESLRTDDNLATKLATIQAAAEAGTSDISSQMADYMAGVNATSRSARKQETLEIVRFEPSVSFTADTERKNVIRNVLYPYYRHIYPGAHWSYTNYNTLNFFTASSVPSDTAILYPNSATFEQEIVNASGVYMLDDEFTFEFYINPRYTTDGPSDDFRAGTVLHLSSCYAVSMVTGSSRDPRGFVDGFRLLLQVSGGADTPPMLVTSATNLAFYSDDNVLSRNVWHHVAIRWSATNNDHTGSFIIDGLERGTFVIPHPTVRPGPFNATGNPDVLVVGNFYEGGNTGNDAQALFFNQNIAVREGLLELVDDGDDTTNTPDHFTFRHPLNAEVHELKIHGVYLSMDQISASMVTGQAETGSLLFYVPPFFTRESPNRKGFGSNANAWPIGGIMQTPFFSIDGTTVDPFNVALSFGVDGRMINLENFTRDFATGLYPRLLHLSASEIGATVDEALSANSLLYDEHTHFFSGSVRKRNATILPNDNGRFKPNYLLLLSGGLDYNPLSGSQHDRYVNDFGNLDLSMVSLAQMLPTGVLFRGLAGLESGSVFAGIAGSSPENIGVDPGEVLTIFQRTQDPSSNLITFFDVSNLYYGLRILPGSFVISDPAITGTSGKVRVTLRDNGQGGLYRADCSGSWAMWSNVGDIFYDEGIVVVKSPHVPFFGTDAFRVDLRGEHNVHLMRLSVLARAGEINSSSNPTFQPLSASLLAHETDARFVMISGLNFHDDDLNVIMKTRLAQPVIKRISDKLMIRAKIDF